MADIIKGGVGSLEIQPGWVIESDGEGLLTSRVTFRGRKGSEGGRPEQGKAHPEDSRLKCYRSGFTMDASWVTVFADYIGLETGANTKMKIQADFATQVQPIQAHPDFATLKTLGWNSEERKFDEDNQEAIDNGLVGITSYLTPDQQLTASFYTANQGEIQGIIDSIGSTFGAGGGMSGGEAIVRSNFKPISEKHIHSGLITGASYETYAHLYKVTMSFRITSGGWNSLVYGGGGEAKK
jgi:hypothetical protein